MDTARPPRSSAVLGVISPVGPVDVLPGSGADPEPWLALFESGFCATLAGAGCAFIAMWVTDSAARFGHEPDFVQTGLLGHGQGLRHALIAHPLVALNVQIGLGLASGFGL